MSQFSAALLIHTNGQNVECGNAIELNGEQYFVFTVWPCDSKQAALDHIFAMVENESFKRDLVFFRAIQFAVMQRKDNELLVGVVEFDYIEKDKILMC